MAKLKNLKSNSNSIPDTSKQVYELSKLGYIFYPDFDNGKWFICYEYKGQKTKIKKAITQKEINISLAKTILFIYEKVKK